MSYLPDTTKVVELWASLGLKWPAPDIRHFGVSKVATCHESLEVNVGKPPMFHHLTTKFEGDSRKFELSLLQCWDNQQCVMLLDFYPNVWWGLGISKNLRTVRTIHAEWCRCPSTGRYSLPSTTAVQFGDPETAEVMLTNRKVAAVFGLWRKP